MTKALVLSVLLLAGCALPPPSIPSRGEAVYQIVLRTEDGRDRPFATAWHAGQGRFVTNAHVVETARQRNARILLRAAGGGVEDLEPFGARLHPHYSQRALGSPFDVAVLETAPVRELSESLMLASDREITSLRPGDSLSSIGFPFEGPLGALCIERPVPYHSFGRVSRVTDEEGGPLDSRSARGAVIAHDLPIAGGASGSPIFAASGSVIGMVHWSAPLVRTTAGTRVLAPLGTAVRADAIRELLDARVGSTGGELAGSATPVVQLTHLTANYSETGAPSNETDQETERALISGIYLSDLARTARPTRTIVASPSGAGRSPWILAWVDLATSGGKHQVLVHASRRSSMRRFEGRSIPGVTRVATNTGFTVHCDLLSAAQTLESAPLHALFVAIETEARLGRVLFEAGFRIADVDVSKLRIDSIDLVTDPRFFERTAEQLRDSDATTWSTLKLGPWLQVDLDKLISRIFPKRSGYRTSLSGRALQRFRLGDGWGVRVAGRLGPMSTLTIQAKSSSEKRWHVIDTIDLWRFLDVIPWTSPPSDPGETRPSSHPLADSVLLTARPVR